jgi:ribonuclease/clavin/mitogillin
VVIVDPGSPNSEELVGLDRVVEEALRPGGRVLAVLLTHRHRDHVAGVEVVRDRYRAPVWAHHLVGDRVWLDRELHEGEVIELSGRHPRRLRVLETPGHSRSHLAFLEETSGTLIAGDLVSGLGTVVIDPPEGNLRDYLASLERVRGLGLRSLVPGHGPPNRGVDATLDALIRHRQMRESRVLRALEAGAMTEEALRDEAYADTPGADPALALRTLRAHLEKLEAEARVRRTEDGRIERVPGTSGPRS